jgi:hypothetical protein
MILGQGQLPAVAAAIVTGNNIPGSNGTKAAISLANTSASLTETILLTYTTSTATGTATRRLKRVVLAPNETAIVGNLIIQQGDTINGSSTDATTVDYIAYEDSSESQSGNMQSFDSSGSPKGAPSGSAITGATTLTSTSANAFAVGRQGVTNPAFNVDASAATSVTGLNVAAAASGAGLALSVTSSAGAENLTVDAKSTGTLTLNGTATGNVIAGANLQITDAKNIVLATTTGTTIGASTTQKLSFWNATPIVQPTNATDLYNVLVNTGLIASGGTPGFSPPGTVTIADTKNIVLATTTGTTIGASTTQKLSFWNATPIVQPTNSTDLYTVLVNTGLIASGGTPAFSPPGTVNIADAKNIVLATTTGTDIGTSTTQKLGFYGVTPVVQPTASTDKTTAAAGTSTGVSLDTTFKGASGSTAYTIGGVVTQLKALGLIAA